MTNAWQAILKKNHNLTSFTPQLIKEGRWHLNEYANAKFVHVNEVCIYYALIY